MMGSRAAWDMKDMRIDNHELRRRLKAVEEAGLAAHASDRDRVNAMLMAIGLDYTAIPPAKSEDTEFPGGVRYHPHTLRRFKRERDEALAANTELGKMYLDAVSASQGHEMEAAMLESQRDALEKALESIRELSQWDYDDDNGALEAARRIASEALAASGTESVLQ